MKIALLVPVYQPPALEAFMQNVQKQLAVCQRLWPQVHIQPWLIDDGAPASVASTIGQLRAQGQCRRLTLSRHFGYLASVQAGLATVAADAYLVFDAGFAAQLASLPAMVDALVVGGCAVVAFKQHRRELFHDCAMNAAAKRALLQACAHGRFGLDVLAGIGFKQKRLPWQGACPERPRIPRVWALAAVLLLALLIWWPASEIIVNVGLFAAVFWLWRRPKQVAVPYVVMAVD